MKIVTNCLEKTRNLKAGWSIICFNWMVTRKDGFGPKALLLSGIAACSGIDVVDILEKMRVEFSDLTIDVETEQTDEHPKVFKEI